MTEKQTIDLDRCVQASDDEFDALMEELAQLCAQPKGRFTPVALTLGGQSEDTTAGRALLNLALCYPYRMVGRAPAWDRIAHGQVDASAIDRLCSGIVSDLYDDVAAEDLSRAMAAVSNYLGDLGISTAGRVGASISLYSLLESASREPRVWDLLNWTAPSGDFSEIERAADAATEELIGILKGMPDSELGRLLRSGAAINKDQFRQALVNVGVKPGLMDGELMEEPIDTSFLNGMRNVEDFFICAIGARKALVTNHRQVKTSGYLSRKLVLLLAGHYLSKSGLEDCGTPHGLDFVVASRDHAERLQRRLMRVPGEREDYFVPTREELEGLIGKRVVMRSPVTCAGHDGVCHACYGKLAPTNSHIHAGIYGVLRIAEQITQRLLSSKHLLKARPMTVVWPDEFLTGFSVERTSVVVESCVDRVFVKLDDLDEPDEEDRRGVSVFHFKMANKQGKIRIDLPFPLYLVEEVWGELDADDGELVLQAQPETAIFQVPVTNNDLSQALYMIFNLIEREENSDLHGTYSRLLALLEQTAIETPSIHAEMIVRALVRDAEDHMRRPDFTVGPDMPPYVVLKLTAAILASPSLSNSLAFERIRAQLTSPDIFQKTDESPMDALFGA